MKIEYVPQNFRVTSLERIAQVNEIIDDYQAQGYDMTIRQIFYQMVSKNLIPNTKRDYKNFGTLVSKARLGGFIDWSAIVDPTRTTRTKSHWSDPKGVLKSAYEGYSLDYWETQDYRPRIWIEKEALIGVIQKTASTYDVPYLACKGYMSQSAMWHDARIAKKQIKEGFKPIIIHLGDHDPSGLDMSRDIDDRMQVFGVNYEIKRIALNIDQVEELNPPPNYTKMKDTRTPDYVAEFGYDSWELDALTPVYINNLVRDAIEDLIIREEWNLTQDTLKADKLLLKSIHDSYDDIENFLEENGLMQSFESGDDENGE